MRASSSFESGQRYGIHCAHGDQLHQQIQAIEAHLTDMQDDKTRLLIVRCRSILSTAPGCEAAQAVLQQWRWRAQVPAF